MDTLDFASPEIFAFERPRRRVVAPRVLVVDDDAAFRDLLVEFLWEAGYQVQAACDGLDAFRQIDPRIEDEGVDTSIDLVILDMSMPRMTGLQFAAHLRAWSLSTPVVAMTAFPDAQFYRQTCELGCAAAFAKPFSVFQLLDFIDRFFDR